MKNDKMANNVIKFDKYAKPALNYREILKNFADELDKMSESCFSVALKLALSKKWKEWDESTPVGSTFDFDEGMLLDTGDEFVTDATKLRLDMLGMIERIKKHMYDKV